MSFTRVQYALLLKWRDGNFERDWTQGEGAYAPIPKRPTSVTPHGLDRASLDACVGGPFFPGIEVGWLVREPSLYRRAFRPQRDTGLKVGVLELRAGFFSQQMALPWHADFDDCHKEDHTPKGSAAPQVYMWWTTIRPDDIRETPDGEFRRWVAPFDENRSPGVDDPDALENLARFENMHERCFRGHGRPVGDAHRAK